MKVFITASFKGKRNKKEIEKLCMIVKKAGFEDFCFIKDVENYQKIFNNPKELMNKAKEKIKKCDVLLFDATKKSTGKAIEVGIAFSYNKKIIVMKKEGTTIKDTLLGVADIVITYNTFKDIQNSLNNLYIRWSRI